MPALVQELNLAAEAERRRRIEFYNEIDEDSKAEFINGEVVHHSPAKAMHNRVVARLLMLLRAHVQLGKCGEVFAEKALIALTRNDYEPDIVFFGPTKAATIGGGMMRHPAPDLVVEVLSDSTAQNDRGIKFRDYEAHGVSEYWIIDPDREIFERFVLREGCYVGGALSADATVESAAIAGFSLRAAAAFRDEIASEELRRLVSGS